MKRVFLLLLAFGLFTTGCGGGDDITIEGQWARNSPMMASMGAVYMTIESAQVDRLMSASVDSSIAASVEIHEVVAADDSTSDDSMSDDSEVEGMGMMMMQEVEAIDLPAGEKVALQPGGYHVMLIDLPAPLEIGQKFDLTLNFENYGEKVIEVEVMEMAP